MPTSTANPTARAERPGTPPGLREDPSGEFDRQLAVLVEKGYPAAAGLGEAAFAARIEPLRPAALAATPTGPERIPFVVVVTRELVSTTEAVARVRVGQRDGWTDLEPGDLARFGPIEPVELPAGGAYLVLDVDTGTDSLGLKPDDVLPTVLAAGRTPLTIDEGLAVITQFPGILRSHNAYQLMGSRCGDKRVPAIWTSKGAPRLGWCWAGNHHTWLGMATAATRAAPPR